MTIDLTGRTAVVTGASKGIGLAIATSLLNAGADVVISGRDAGRLKSAVIGLSADDHRIARIVCDVADSKAASSLIDQAVARFGGLDILIPNAGVGTFKPVYELTDEDWSSQIDTNLTGVFNVVRPAVEPLADAASKRGDAWIVAIASLASRNAMKKGTAYNASKFGLLGFMEALLLDLRPKGIRTCTIMPGSVATEFGTGHNEPEWMLHAEDVAQAVVDTLSFPRTALVSRVEMRPSFPPSS